MPRPQFILRALLVLTLVFACSRFERERQRRADEAAQYAAELRAWERKWQSASKLASRGAPVQARPHPSWGRIWRELIAHDPDPSEF